MSAGIGAAVAETVTYPLCTLKSHAQVGNLRSAWRDAYHAAVLSKRSADGSGWWRRGGWGGLYQGLQYAVLAQTITSAGKWTAYRWLDARSAQLPWRSAPRDMQRVINSTSTGVAVSLVTHLLDFLRVHSQLARRSDPAKNVRAQYRGYSKTLGKTVVGGATYVPMFEHLWRTREWPITLAALTASLVSATVTHPLDYAKQRHMFLGHIKDQTVRGNEATTGHRKLPLWRACWTGWSISLARVVPHFAVMMSITGTLEPIILRRLAHPH